MEFTYAPQGTVTASIGTKDGNLHSVSPVAYNWYIEENGNLVLTYDDRTTPYATLRLMSLTDGSAIVVNTRSATKQAFARRYID